MPPKAMITVQRGSVSSNGRKALACMQLLAEWTYSMRAVFLPTPTTTPNGFFFLDDER